MSVGSIPSGDVLMGKNNKPTKPTNNPDDRDMFGTPKNRSKTWDIKKNRDPKQDRRKSKKELNVRDYKKKDNTSNGC